MDNNWIIDNLNYAFGVWNDKLTEMWSLLSQSPQAFKGGAIWQTIQTVNGAMQGIGYGLLVLFLAIGIFRSSASFRDSGGLNTSCGTLFTSSWQSWLSPTAST